MDITAYVRKIEQLKDYLFIVPSYQREYVWKADVHVARFLQDINDEFQPNNSKQSSYFIGSAIILKNSEGKFDVIDGQQRLTTVIISLCAMRQALKSYQPTTPELLQAKEEFQRIVQELLYKYDLDQLKHIPRLELQYAESSDYLLKLITGQNYVGDQSQSIIKMQEAYSTISNFLVTFQQNDLLLNFIRYFLHHVELVMIMPDSLGSALKIFETINERGVGLNAMDLLKNLLFSQCSTDEFESIKPIWKDILQYLNEGEDKDNPLRFLRYFLMGKYHNGILREDQIYQWLISPGGIASTRYKQQPIQFASELKMAARKYAHFIKATTAWNADPIYPNITGIGYLSGGSSRQHLVLLMALPENTGVEIINKLAKNIEALAFYFAANRLLTKYYEEKYAGWAISLRTITALSALQDFLKGDFKAQLQEQQARFNAQFANKGQGDLNPQYRIKYILGKMENYIRENVNFPINDFTFYQQQQLEHILPQTPDNIPVRSFPQPFDYNNSVARIGNLTLLEAPINQSLNKTNDLSTDGWFEAKRNAYLKSSIFLTRTLSEIRIGKDTTFNTFATKNLKAFDKWNMQTISERQEMMRLLCLQAWQLDV